MKPQKKYADNKELIEQAVADHMSGRVRKNINLVQNPAEIEYLKMRTDLTVLHSEANAQALFQKLTNRKQPGMTSEESIRESTFAYLSASKKGKHSS